MRCCRYCGSVVSKNGLVIQYLLIAEPPGIGALHAQRVEDEVVPVPRLLEALVPAQRVGDEQRCVEEQLPVVRRVGAVRGEVDDLVWIIISHGNCGGNLTTASVGR